MKFVRTGDKSSGCYEEGAAPVLNERLPLSHPHSPGMSDIQSRFRHNKRTEIALADLGPEVDDLAKSGLAVLAITVDEIHDAPWDSDRSLRAGSCIVST